MAPLLAAIVAMDESRVIGKNNKLPWHIPEDLARFKALTMGAPVIMGRKTWDSFPSKVKPLPGRKNIVVSRQIRPHEVPLEVAWCATPEEALTQGALSAQECGCPRVWVLGGAELYKILFPRCDEIYLTLVKGVHEGDAYLPPFEEHFDVDQKEKLDRCSFINYVRNV
jgi:dihydrofolate reductase